MGLVRLIVQPTAVRAAAAALAFLAVFYTDYYYVLYAALAGSAALAFRLAAGRAELKNTTLYWAMGLFAGSAVAGAGPMVAATSPFMKLPLTGSHNPFEFGADLLSPFVPGKYWRFHELTEPLWSSFKTPPVEGCAYLCWPALILAGIGVVKSWKSLGWREWFLLSSGVFFLAWRE